MTNTVKLARAYAIAVGELVADRGRLDPVHIKVWEDHGRPVLYGPVVPPISRATGAVRGGRRSKVTLDDGTVWEVTKEAAHNARYWAVENNVDIPAKGRLSVDVLQQWVDNGMPQREPLREERASVIYRNTLDKAGRRNAALKKLHTLTVYSDQLPGTKPRSSDYVRAVRSELPAGAVVVRIVTANTLIDVSLDDNGEYVYRWISKRDSKEVVNTLLGSLSVQ